VYGHVRHPRTVESEVEVVDTHDGQPESLTIGIGSEIAGYRVDALVSRGGMGVVYCATNVALGQRYALKVIAPELADDQQFLERFRREIRLAASLRHPHAVVVHYAGEFAGQPFLVMDLIDGTNLREVIVTEGALDPGRAVELLTQITGALDEGHGPRPPRHQAGERTHQ
jgi:serine/threonine protein kinase